MIANKYILFAGLLYVLFSVSIIASPKNLVLHRPAAFAPQPNHGPCTDPEDVIQLTDGVFKTSAKGVLSTQKGTVGWRYLREPIFITFDLGEPKRIGSISIHSAAGAAGAAWPAAIGFFFSEDGKTWAYGGELISRSSANGLPEPMSYSEHRFVADNINAQARHVLLCVLKGGSIFFFTDEVEILEGEGGGEPTIYPMVGDREAIARFLSGEVGTSCLLRRLRLDQTRIRKAAQTLPPEERAAFEADLDALSEECRNQTVINAENFRTEMPLNATQDRLLALYGRLLEKQGYPRLLLTKVHRYAYLQWLETPSRHVQEPIHLKYRQMRGETRADLVLATNAAAAPVSVTFALNAPTEAIRVYYTPWTDTPQLEPVATALVPAERIESGWRFSIPAGLTTKVWVSVDGAKLPPGEHHFEGWIEVPDGFRIPISLSASISPVTMERPALHLGMWDYTDRKSLFAVTPDNRDAAIAMMRSMGVDSPWASSSCLPMPASTDYDAEDRLLSGRLDFSRFDAWLRLWPDARRYMIYINAGEQFANVGPDSPHFAPRLEQWAAAVQAHIASRTAKPVCLLLVDEPKNDERDRRLVNWARPVKKGAPDLVIWSDPVRADPTASGVPEAFDVPDVLCPDSATLARGGDVAAAFFRAKQAQGKPLETYACSALAPHTDPNRYYRLLSWSGWPFRMVGVGFWSFGDTAGLRDAWYAYGHCVGIQYAPAFVGRHEITDTLQMQAIREGLLDYEYLTMLENSLSGITDPARRKEAAALCSDEAVKEVFQGWSFAESTAWKGAAGHEAPDEHRWKILSILEKIHADTL